MALAAPMAGRDDGPMESAFLPRLLAGTWFATDIPAEPLARLASLGKLVDHPIGAVVIREGQPCRELGVVISGLIAIRMHLPGGEDRTILTIEPGDIVGWSALVPPGAATSTAVAVARSTVVVFDGSVLSQALARDHELAAAVYQRLLASVARRLTATRVQLLDLYRPANEPW